MNDAAVFNLTSVVQKAPHENLAHTLPVNIPSMPTKTPTSVNELAMIS